MAEIQDEKTVALDVQPTDAEERRSGAPQRKPSLLDRIKRRTSTRSSRPPSYKSTDTKPPTYEEDKDRYQDNGAPIGMPLSMLRAVLGNPEAVAPRKRPESSMNKDKNSNSEQQHRNGAAGAAWHLGREPGSEPRTRAQFNAQGARLSELGRLGR